MSPARRRASWSSRTSGLTPSPVEARYRRCGLRRGRRTRPAWRRTRTQPPPARPARSRCGSGGGRDFTEPLHPAQPQSELLAHGGFGLVLAVAAARVLGCEAADELPVPHAGDTFVTEARTDRSSMQAVPDVVSPAKTSRRCSRPALNAPGLRPRTARRAGMGVAVLDQQRRRCGGLVALLGFLPILHSLDLLGSHLQEANSPTRGTFVAGCTWSAVDGDGVRAAAARGDRTARPTRAGW
jgi:hypothetical protein